MYVLIVYRLYILYVFLNFVYKLFCLSFSLNLAQNLFDLRKERPHLPSLSLLKVASK